jgi:hypothetical protein
MPRERVTAATVAATSDETASSFDVRIRARHADRPLPSAPVLVGASRSDHRRRARSADQFLHGTLRPRPAAIGHVRHRGRLSTDVSLRISASSTSLSRAQRIVRPGGTMLASEAGSLPLTGDVPEYCRLSPDGWRERLAGAWSGVAIEGRGYGNGLAGPRRRWDLPSRNSRTRSWTSSIRGTQR